jgi:hypothetical protein
MAIWTNVPDSNLEPGDPIRSVDIIAIKENTVYNREHTILDILNSQTFTSSTTWTRPGGFDATDSVIAVIIGGGGAGGSLYDSSGGAGGGGGGGVLCVAIPYGSVGSSVTVTVGLGGTGVTETSFGSGKTGNQGGTSSFGSYAAYGGLGGSGINFTGGFGGGPKFISNSTNLSITSVINGASGCGGATAFIQDGFTGGGGASTVLNPNRTGGTSLFFGNGGTGAQSNTNNATAGTTPGGGGGGIQAFSFNPTGAAGARGEVRVYVVRGKVAANAFLGSTTVSVAY